MKFVILFSLILSPMAFALSETPVSVSGGTSIYSSYNAQIYEGKTGKSFPYRVTLTKVVGGCTSLNFSKTDLPGFSPSHKVLFFKADMLALGMVCPELKSVSQSFDFSNEEGQGFLEIIVDTKTTVRVDRLN